MAAEVQSANEKADSLDLRTVIDSTPGLIHTSEADGYLDFFNQTWLRYVGQRLEHLQGWKWTAVIHPDDVEGIVEKWRASLASGEPFLHEARVLRADGKYRWMLHHKVALRNQQDKIVKWYGSSIDIEDRKRAEEELRAAMSERARLAAVRAEIGMALARKDKLKGILDLCAKALVRHLDATFARIWTLSGDGRELELQASAGIYTRLDGRYGRIPFGKFKIGSIAQARKPHVTNSVQNDPRIDNHEWARAEKMTSFAGYPLVVEDRVVGVMGMFSRKALDQGTIDSLSFIADSIAQSIERKHAEDTLHRSESYLAEGQRLGHTGSWAFDPAGFFSHWSHELLRMYGLDPAREAPNLEEYLAMIHPQDREFMRSLLKQMVTEALGCDVKKRIVRPGGDVRYIRCVGAPIVEDGTLQRIVGTAIDVTDHELLTQELRTREAYLAEAQRLSQTGSFGWKPDSGEIVWSEETYRIFEYDRGTKPVLDMVVQRAHPDDKALVQQVIDRASQSGTEFEHEYRLLMPDGRVKHVHALAHVVQDASGTREFVGAVTDITARKTAEEALRCSEAYLAEAQRLSHTGSWAWSPDRDIRYWSEECYRVLSFDPQNGLPRFEDFLQRLHPDDQPGFRELIQTAIREKAECEADYRIVHLDGPVRDIHVVGHPVLSASGQLVEFVGTVIDITERKAAEEKIREQEMELRQMLDLTPQQVAVFGPNSERIYANRVALDYVGLSLEEWLQTSGGLFRPGWFIHPDDRERAARGYSDGTRSGGSAYEMELRVQGADGSYRWFLVRYNPLRDEHGQTMRWYVAATDIEDRKRAEQKLQLENAALREEIDQTSMFEEIVGTSPALQTVLSRISKVAPSDSTVLITGETGTGKELVARAIHRRSRRCGRAFVSVNCAAIPRDLIASELFGHEKGAFTGAMQRRLGRFEMADGGTIFLDEVGELSPDTQVALLRVLQEREFERVGGGHPIHVDVRVIAATNRDLEAAVSNGTFRQDLFYRLNVFPLEVPPLRERKDDVLMLVEYFVQRYAIRAGKNIRLIEKKTLDLLQSYAWPGNIRELQNVIERSVILSSGEALSVDELWLSKETSQPASRVDASPRLDGDSEPRSEREIVEAALVESRGRVSGPSGAAAKLGIPPSTLDHRIKALKIHKKQFKFR